VSVSKENKTFPFTYLVMELSEAETERRREIIARNDYVLAEIDNEMFLFSKRFTPMLYAHDLDRYIALRIH